MFEIFFKKSFCLDDFEILKRNLTVLTDNNQSLECNPNLFTNRSDNQPPAKTPKLPPKMEQAVIHNPGL